MHPTWGLLDCVRGWSKGAVVGSQRGRVGKEAYAAYMFFGGRESQRETGLMGDRLFVGVRGNTLKYRGHYMNDQ